MATLYALQDKFELSKSYLDLVQNSSIQYARKHDMGLIYYFIATQIKKTDIRLECFNSAAENFSKAKDWIKVILFIKIIIFCIFYSLFFCICKFCHVEIAHAQLLNELGMFKQVEYVTENILRACFCLSDKYQLGNLISSNNFIYRILLHRGSMPLLKENDTGCYSRIMG